MRIIHKGGFPEDERYQTRAVIYSNLVVAFKVLLDIMNTENIEYEHENTRVTPPELGPTFGLPGDSHYTIVYFIPG